MISGVGVQLKLLKQSQPEKAETHTCHHQDISSGVQTFYPGDSRILEDIYWLVVSTPLKKSESQLGLLFPMEK